MKDFFSPAVLESLAIVCYFALFLLVAVITFRRQHTATDYMLGNRSMNYFLTALAAHASDMSSWLFMGYPALVYSLGMHQAWAGIGLLVCMFFNWQLIAPRVRAATEQYNSLTFSSFFENRLGDSGGVIRVFTAIMLFVFYTIYISAALVGMGYVLHTLFNLPYIVGVLVGVGIVIPYVFIGGYLTIAHIDLFQGLFLLAVILFVPFYILPQVGGWSGMFREIHASGQSTSLFPNFQGKTLMDILFLATGWGLGYFGQPHIITKFMGIKNVSEIKFAKRVGMTWMTLALGAATLVGLLGIAFFTQPLKVDAEVFIEMVKQSFSPFISAFLLCAVFAAAINAMSSMVLVLTSSMTEDIYKKLIRKQASSKERLLASRFGVILVSLIAASIAFGKISTIYGLVLYAWSGLGAAFGPLLLLCLHMRTINKYGAWTGILSGGSLAAGWPLFDKYLPIHIPPLLPAFFVSLFLIWLVSTVTRQRSVLTEI